MKVSFLVMHQTPKHIEYSIKPPAVMSSLRADSMSRPEQKMFNDTSSGRDMSGLDAKRRKNLAHVVPMDSFSNYSKLRMSIGGKSMRSMRENE